jgi:hypothetical protein
MKKKTSLFLVAALTLTLLTGVSTAAAFTTADALTALRAAAGLITLTPQQAARLDINGDSAVNSADAVAILRVAAGLPAFPSVFNNAGYTGPWPDFNAYVPFDYCMSRVIFATSFENPAELCTCEVPKNCYHGNYCEGNTWKRRWDPDRNIRPLVNGERIETTVYEFYGNMILELSEEHSIHGNSSLLAANRPNDWAGAIFDITDFLLDNVVAYEIFAWVKMPEASDPGRVQISAQTNGLDGEEYRMWTYYDESYVRDDGWVLLRGTTHFVKMFYDKIYVYIETRGGNPNNQPIYIDCLTILIAE